MLISSRFQVLSHAFSVTGPMDQPYHVSKEGSGLSDKATSGIVNADDLSHEGRFSS